MLLSSCKDIFLRFKYQTIECQENSFDLSKISIKNDPKQGCTTFGSCYIKNINKQIIPYLKFRKGNYGEKNEYIL